MPCYHPWKQRRAIKGRPGQFWADLPARELPCGQCIGCRMARAADWQTRIAHEAQLHDANCFVTLTFAPEHIPQDHSVRVRHVQLFMKRLRKALGHGRVRYFACGEYGEQNFRPHYHLILFGYCPADLVPWRKTGSGFVVSRSAFLERVWPYGHVEVGTVTTQSAGYVARYVIKKSTGEAAAAAYSRADPDTGETWQVEPEFICMSSKPGIGRGWYDKFSSDAFPSDFVVLEGQKRPVPRYYLKQLKAAEGEQLATPSTKVLARRNASAREHAADRTPDRLAVREESQQLRAKRLKREMESES